MSDVIYQKILSTNDTKGFQLRLVYNSYRDNEYLHIRKYFLSYEGDYVPSTEGISIPATFESIKALLAGLLDLCSEAEGKELINMVLNERKS